MNDLSFNVIKPIVQEFFTAREMAELAKRLGYQGLPHTESGVVRRAKRDGWTDQSLLCRKRGGRDGGGGFEYHISLVPHLHSMQMLERKISADAETRQVVAVREAAALPALPAERPRAKAELVAEARVQILTAIIGFASRTGRKVSQGIAEFLKAQDGHAFWLEACANRDRGAYLPASQTKALQIGSPLERQDMFWLSADVLERANDRPRKGALFCKVSRSTLYSWMAEYEAQGFRALAPQTTKHTEEIPQDFWRFMAIFSRPAKLAITRSHARYLKQTPEGVTPLTLNQVEYTLREKLDHIQRNKGREGPLTMRARMAYVSRDTSDLLPTAIYVADGHTFDAEIADPSSGRAMRPEITSIIDVATRRLVGRAISRKENVIAVCEALSNACSENGICAVFYTDRGAGYKNKRFDNDDAGLMSRLGITKMHALPYNSQAKGNIERSHQSIWIPLAQEFPTYLGDRMDKEARHKAFKTSRRDLKEFGQSDLLMGWEEFHRVVAERAEQYNNEPHSALAKIQDMVTGRWRHMSPNEAWAMQVQDGFEPVKVADEVLDDLFRPYERRKVSRCLVEIHTNSYFSLELNPYHEEWVYVGYDDNQADKVWVRKIDPATNEPGHLICVAIFGGNTRSYMPKTHIEIAQEKRLRTALSRNDERRRAIEEEALAPLTLDHRPTEMAMFPDIVPAADPVSVSLAIDNTTGDASAEPVPPRRRIFRSDEELAAWALRHPTELSSNQIRVLRDCISNSTGRTVLEMAGIDTEALRTLLRAAA